MTTRTMLALHAIIGLAIGLPFTAVHLLARPDDAPISPLQHLGAAAGNFLGPWGVAFVRLVDFPNAGLRSFSWALAAGLTLVGSLLVILAARSQKRFQQLALAATWTLFLIIWFGVGFSQIADGLL